MPKKIVGVTQRVDKIESYDECRDALDQKLIDWIVQSGFIPVPIPNTLVNITSPNGCQPTLDNWLNTVKIDSILLSGGNDIGDINSRDITEKYLLSWAEENRKPVLGICRGMQNLGVYFGGKLIAVDGHVRTRHQLQVKNSNISSLPKSVNSYHNLALENCPDTLKIFAKSEDGNIEAIKHKELPWEGWMWHPERDGQFNLIDQERFKKLMNSGK
jgi:N5-(cytidine 5'-diphosphoramidyl)-L-glutamine hydrolase